jgi:hypothetical protein
MEALGKFALEEKATFSSTPCGFRVRRDAHRLAESASEFRHVTIERLQRWRRIVEYYWFSAFRGCSMFALVGTCVIPRKQYEVVFVVIGRYVERK